MRSYTWLNCTFMELKARNTHTAHGLRDGLIVPLWNWKNVGSASSCMGMMGLIVQLSQATAATGWTLRPFQFHKGTIKPFAYVSPTTGYYHFQFHKGTIKPHLTIKRLRSSSLFQFHKGTIKPVFCHFLDGCDVFFQFHKGTIKPALLLTFANTSKRLSIP